MSQKILSDRLKLQMGLDPKVDIEYQVLQSMSLQLMNERLQERTYESNALAR